MERIEQYRQSIRQILTSHGNFESGNSDNEVQNQGFTNQIILPPAFCLLPQNQ
ncbi:hypothetical protein [Nostoc sp. FACHB-888]|uniref:hypothetical protein n=1 Tax=Nostoc sp. FACHB-888 TaxID=2692842 RepID=UPI001683E17E|nr:hypothetical protein [Nostoc sp. FACHB-888]MBD2244221.1 hypothetical protein [Nostoc sp. FACHB-888]